MTAANATFTFWEVALNCPGLPPPSFVEHAVSIYLSDSTILRTGFIELNCGVLALATSAGVGRGKLQRI